MCILIFYQNYVLFLHLWTNSNKFGCKLPFPYTSIQNGEKGSSHAIKVSLKYVNLMSNLLTKIDQTLSRALRFIL